MITYVENMKTIPNYGTWLMWTESDGRPENLSVYVGYLDYILLKLGSRYDNIHVKLIKTMDIEKETPPLTRSKKVHFFLHDMDFTNLSMDDRMKYMKALMIGRHAAIIDEETEFDGRYTYYTLKAHLSAEEKRQEEINEILNKLEEEDRNRLVDLLKISK